MQPESEGILISAGIIVLGNIIKPKNRDIGNGIQGLGIGTGIGILFHIIDKNYPSDIPHHDKLAAIGLPIIFILDKTNIIKNKDLTMNLYGIDLGLLGQHLLTEGCSLCNNHYCNNGEKLC
jgi:hypothetical protein